ncbi:murein hydrolase activator EnvC family protein [Halomonas sp. WWR20]
MSRRRIAQISAVTLLSVAAWIMPVASLAQDTPSSEREAQAQLGELQSDIQALQQRLDTTRNARGDASRELKKIETALGETHQRLDALHAERRRLDDELETLAARQDSLEAERDAQRQALAQQLDALYRLGLTPQLKLLLNQDDPARLDRLQTYLNRLSRARQARLEALARLNTQLNDTQNAIQARRERLASLTEELTQRSAALAAQQAERKSLLASLEQRYASEQVRLEELNQDRAHAERILKHMQEELARLKQPPPSTRIEQTRGELPWPVQGRLVSAYGQGEGVDRNGILIAAPEGTPVKAVHPGRVVFADWMRGFGNLLIVDHGDGVMTLYAHLQQFAVDVGARVERDAPIAAVGNTGGRPNPGLYFEVRQNGEPIDPRRWIARR